MDYVDGTQGDPTHNTELKQGDASGNQTQVDHGETKPHQNNPKPSFSASSSRKLCVAWRRTKPHDRIITGATIVIMFVACIQAFIYYQMKGIMESSSKQTDKLIDYAKAQACAAKSFAVSASNINAGIGTAVEKLNLQADKLNDSVTQTSRLADATEKANANVVSSDRPWMGISAGAKIDRITPRERREAAG